MNQSKQTTSIWAACIFAALLSGCEKQAAIPENLLGDRTEKVRIDYETSIALMRLRELARNGEWEAIKHAESGERMGVYHVSKRELKIIETDRPVERLK